MPTKIPSANVWLEPAITAAALPIPAFWQDNGAGAYELATTGSRDAALIDWNDDGVYELLELQSPYILIDNGGTMEPATSGTAAAILIDDGNDGLVASTDLTETEAGRFYPATAGNVVAARFDAAVGRFLNIGTTYRLIT